MIERFAEDMQQLDDESFYERLQQLKEDHKKTLQICESAYKQKVRHDHLI